MPKKLNPETPEEQAKRFRKEARSLIKSGALDGDQGDAALDRLVRRAGKTPSG